MKSDRRLCPRYYILRRPRSVQAEAATTAATRTRPASSNGIVERGRSAWAAGDGGIGVGVGLGVSVGVAGAGVAVGVSVGVGEGAGVEVGVGVGTTIWTVTGSPRTGAPAAPDLTS